MTDTDVSVKDPVELECVSVDNLQVGMFLVAICRQIGSQKVSNPGRVTQNHINQLRKRGALQVMIDPARSQIASPIEIEVPEVNQELGAAEPHQLTEHRALQTYHQAMVIQRRYFAEVKHGEAIDIGPFRRAADELIGGLDGHSDALLCLARIRDKDDYLMEHSLNVGMLLAYFARSMGWSRAEQRELLVGGMLHDIGKVETPDEVLHKPGKLDDKELEIMREHVVNSHRILSETPGISQLMLEVASNHHERLDGKGYPNGLAYDQLSQASRMSTIVDCYDALTADRVYKSGMPPTSAFQILLKGRDTQFDKELLIKFIHCMGVFPAGTWVRLESGKVGLVIKRNLTQPLKPVVRVVYSAQTKSYTLVKELNLARLPSEAIECAVSARDYGIDVSRFSYPS